MAEAKLSMSLDDIIKQNDKKREAKKSTKAPTARAKSTASNLSAGRGNASNVRVVPRATRGGGVTKRAPTRLTVSISNTNTGRRANNSHPATRAYIPETRAAAVAPRGNVNARWQHDMFQEAVPVRQAPRAAPRADGTKLQISNLDYNVSNDDIRELFETVGQIKSAFIKYDRSGRSEGTAEVVFVNRTDAMRAREKYNNVLLDGKKMVIELEATDVFSRLGRNDAAPRSGVQVTRTFQQATRASSRVPGGGKMRGFNDDMEM